MRAARELLIAFICLAVGGIFAAIAHMTAESAPPDGPLMPMCGQKRGDDIVAMQCALIIKDGKAEWVKQ